jgi:hypothetical protein
MAVHVQYGYDRGKQVPAANNCGLSFDRLPTILENVRYSPASALANTRNVYPSIRSAMSAYVNYAACFTTSGNFSDNMLWNKVISFDDRKVVYRHDFKTLAKIITPIDGSAVFILVGEDEVVNKAINSLCNDLQEYVFNLPSVPALSA